MYNVHGNIIQSYHILFLFVLSLFCVNCWMNFTQCSGIKYTMHITACSAEWEVDSKDKGFTWCYMKNHINCDCFSGKAGAGYITCMHNCQNPILWSTTHSYSKYERNVWITQGEYHIDLYIITLSEWFITKCHFLFQVCSFPDLFCFVLFNVLTFWIYSVPFRNWRQFVLLNSGKLHLVNGV